MNNYLRRWLKKDENTPLTLKQEAIAGIGTGVVQVAVTNPYEALFSHFGVPYFLLPILLQL